MDSDEVEDVDDISDEVEDVDDISDEVEDVDDISEKEELSKESEEESSDDISPSEGSPDDISTEEISEIPDINDLSNILVVGDVHFQRDAFVQGEELIEKLIDAATSISPTIIVLLGDILDNHETVRTSQYKQAERLIDGLRKIAPLYILMGNHDLINASQFLTDAHFFGPFKEWERVVVVDRPIAVTLPSAEKTLSIVMCPYVPPGRFVEALNTLFEQEEPVDWQLADCIFGHQEIAGVVYNGKESTKGDRWDENYPHLILGHIHESCTIGDNVHYAGSARQVAANESPDKKIWNVSFDEEGPQLDPIDLGLKAKKEIEIEYDAVKTFDFELSKRYYVKLKIKGTREQFKLFRKSQLHAKLVNHGVKPVFDVIVENNPLALNLAHALKDDLTFDNILREVVRKKPDVVREAYQELYGDLLADQEETADGDIHEEVEPREEVEVQDEAEDQDSGVTYELVFGDS